MDPVTFFVIAGTIATVTFSWANFLMNTKLKKEEDLDEAEQRILELMGRFKYVSNLRLEMLDKKIDEIKKVIREANEVYSTLTVKITDLMRLKEDFINVEEELNSNSKVSGKEKEVKEIVDHESFEDKNTEILDEDKEEDIETNIEKKILSLHDEGYTDVEIAKKLGVGVGEVQLMIGLFRRGR
ncbi:MAG: hypothetical protein J7L34_01150 [Thermotogaceae bacterium]|nr:hypothetical protein [Thermotogaceae bacterium]